MSTEKSDSSGDGCYLLKFSAFVSLTFALLGIILGTATNSQVIIFDGLYSLVSLGLTLLSIGALALIKANESQKLSINTKHIECSVIFIKSLTILLIVTLSLYSSFYSLLNGGREVDMSIASVFGFINVVVCLFGWQLMSKNSQGSKLLEAETRQWQMDLMISVAVAIGFTFGWALKYTPYADLSSYADPLMMLLMGGYFLKVPYGMMKESYKGLSLAS